MKQIYVYFFCEACVTTGAPQLWDHFTSTTLTTQSHAMHRWHTFHNLSRLFDMEELLRGGKESLHNAWPFNTYFVVQSDCQGGSYALPEVWKMSGIVAIVCDQLIQNQGQIGTKTCQDMVNLLKIEGGF